MHRPRSATALGALAVLALTSCTVGQQESGPEPEPTTSAPAEPSTPATPSAPESSAGSSEPSDPGALAWQPVPGSSKTEATVSGDWTLSVAQGRGGVALTGPERRTVTVPRDYRVTNALIDGDHAVVVAEHTIAEKPDVAEVIELDTGDTTTIDGGSEVPTTVGGSWALGSGLLVHATTSGRDYCLAVVDLRSGESRRGPCVPPRHGINNVRVSPAGIAATTFDDARPSACRTLNRVEGEEFQPLRGVEECHGLEAVTTETAEIYGVAVGERRVEESRYFAESGNGKVALGRGTSGTLTWCGDAAYFVRDPMRDADPARLLRVGPDGSTEVVYESPGRGNAFLSAPRCGGTDLTINALSEAGDEQVSAALG